MRTNVPRSSNEHGACLAIEHRRVQCATESPTSERKLAFAHTVQKGVHASPPQSRYRDLEALGLAFGICRSFCGFLDCLFESVLECRQFRVLVNTKIFKRFCVGCCERCKFGVGGFVYLADRVHKACNLFVHILLRSMRPRQCKLAVKFRAGTRTGTPFRLISEDEGRRRYRQ